MVKLAKESIIDSILKITDTNELREISNALVEETNSPFGGRWNVSASLLKKVA
jgi:hypothetical protein